MKSDEITFTVTKADILAPILAGSFAGGCGLFVGHPFDSLKVRMQVNQNLESPKLNLATVKQLYRGVLPPLLTAGIMQSFLFTTYEYSRVMVRRTLEAMEWDRQGAAQRATTSSSSRRRSSSGHIQYVNSSQQLLSPAAQDHLLVTTYGGIISGMILANISTPIQVVKVQQQVATEGGLLATIRHCYSQAGTRGFYRAYTSMLLLEGPGRGVYFGVYEGVKLLLNNWKFDEKMVAVGANKNNSSDNRTSKDSTSYQPTSELQKKRAMYKYDLFSTNYTPDGSTFIEERSTRMIAAAVAGVLSWVVFYPFDVIKSRMQLDYDRKVYKSTWHAFQCTWRDGGLRAMYRGIGYTVIRAAPVASTILPIYETSKDFLVEML
jgi:solute carrier family 25 (mitochondrial carnitine/acylcarnitine transporter), member 20/29